MMNYKAILAVLLAFAGFSANAQESNTRLITLEEAIITARVQSVDAAVALNELKTSYWSYRTYRASRDEL